MKLFSITGVRDSNYTNLLLVTKTYYKCVKTNILNKKIISAHYICEIKFITKPFGLFVLKLILLK